jgi:hypothetical protein
MKTARSFTLMVLLALAGCVTEPAHRPSETALFSIRLTQGAFTGAEKKDTGFYFFPQEDWGILGEQRRGGIVADVFSGGPQKSAELRREIKAIGFEPFDFDAEVRRLDEELAAKAKQEGGEQTVVLWLDGAEYEIRFEFENVHYVLREWNLGSKTDHYAPYSPKIAKLKALMDLFARYYGRAKFCI